MNQPERLLLADIMEKVDMNDPNKLSRVLSDIELELSIYRERLKQSARYCVGCKCWVPKANAYEDFSVLNGLMRPVLRCHGCKAIVEFL